MRLPLTAAFGRPGDRSVSGQREIAGQGGATRRRQRARCRRSVLCLV